ncbi:MAG: transglycosylase SLT domain-containing protein [Pyrinomonadaceae bacterium]|nr:transglycosylase SLT domain-containing protein [Pyrinomonadaceae bacterium]
MPSHSIKTEYLPEQRISRTESSPQKKTGNGFRIAANGSEPRETVTSPKAQSGTPEQAWIRERTLDELRTIIRAIQLGVTDDWELTDLVFYARHPELKGKPLTSDKKHLLDEWNSISALMVHPTLNEIKDVTGAIDLNELGNNTLEFLAAVENSSTNRIDAGSLRGYTTKYDNLIASAVEWCPGLSPAILKSLLAQESAFNPRVINTYGYAGIAQFGRPAAKEVGLHVGVAGSSSDERLDPAKAIPGAARLLNLKAKRLGSTAFAKYGQPTGVEFWKFVTAAYNGGEGTVSVAMGHAYRKGLTAARNQGLVGREAVSFARKYASNWENLKVGGMNSPLGRAASRYFPSIAIQKYHEIGNYPTQIVARASGNFR